MTELVVEVREPGRSSLTLLVSRPLEVGRDCDGLLLADTQVSRRHLEIRPRDDKLEVTDLGSTNGTFFGDERVEGPRVLDAGEEVRLGSATIRLLGVREGLGPADTGSDEVDLNKRTSIELVADIVSSAGVAVEDHEHRHGTVTIVFSDIEGSTDRNATVGDDAWFELLSQHNDVIRASARRFGGTVVKNQGDGFMLTYPSARRALHSAVDMQQRFDVLSDDLRIRVGMHTGEAIVDDEGDLFGWHVNFAARVAAKAAGGEILVSGLTRAILETRGDIDFGEPVNAELKGIPGMHALHPVTWESLAVK